METYKLVIVVLTLFLAGSATSYTVEEAEKRVTNASTDAQALKDAGVPAKKAEDLLLQANRTLKAEKALEQQGVNVTYERVIELTGKISRTRERAFRTRDELNVLREEIQNAGDINTTEARKHLRQAENDYEKSRFQESLKHVDESYRALSDARAVDARLKAFYQSRKAGVENYVRNNRQEIAFFLIIGLSGSYLGFRELVIFRIRRRKLHLERKKETINELLKQVEQNYYENQDIPKTIFQIRREKYREMLQDVESRIPELEEELEKRFSILQPFYSDLSITS